MRSLRRLAVSLLIMISFSAPGIAQEAEEHAHASPGSEEGLGRAHMEISCSRRWPQSSTARWPCYIILVQARTGRFSASLEC